MRFFSYTAWFIYHNLLTAPLGAAFVLAEMIFAGSLGPRLDTFEFHDHTDTDDDDG